MRNHNLDEAQRRMNLYIVAGPNGAGKTTFAKKFLPNYADCKNFVNADLIAQGLAPFSPETVAFHAGRLMLEEIDLYAKRGEDFGFETTLSGRSYLGSIRRLKKLGYRVHFFFIALPTIDLALSRVRGRVARGGHDIPEPIVRRRFGRAIRNFLTQYRELGDSWFLFDNSGVAPILIASEEQGRQRIINPEVYKAMMLQHGEP
jgi:predicted ABC-type ATPase